MSQAHLTGIGVGGTTDQTDIGNRMMRTAKRPVADQGIFGF